MSIFEFMQKYNIKNQKKVIEWLNNNYIPGTKLINNNWILPQESRPPYTEARAKTTTAIYKSIVTACIKRKGVCAKLYKITESEFQKYISDLNTAGYISVNNIDGIDYYFATLKSDEFIKSKSPEKLIEECLKNVVELAAKGVTSAILEAIV